MRHTFPTFNTKGILFLLTAATVIASVWCAPPPPTSSNSSASASNTEVVVLHDLETFLAGEDDEKSKTQSYGQRCGNRNSCEGELECSNELIGNRCWPPKDCLQTKILDFEEDYNMTTMKARIFEQAGVTEREVLEELSTIHVGFFDKTSDGERGFVPNLASNSPGFRALLDATKSVLNEPSLEHQRIFDECIHQDTGNVNRKLQDDGSPTTINYLVIHFEAGVVLDASFSILVASDNDGYVRFCFGGEVGLGAEIGFGFGILAAREGSTRTALTLACGSVWAEFDAAPGVGAGLGLGIDFLGNTLFELVFVGGLGVGIVGGSLCATFPA